MTKRDLVPASSLKCLALSFFWGLLSLIVVSCAGIHESVSKGDFKKVKESLSSNPELIHDRDEDGGTLLHHAVEHGHVEISRFLIEKGADVNVQDRAGNAPLHLCCARGDLEMVKLLIEKGARVNVTNKKGRTPVDKAHEHNHLKVMEYVSKYMGV